MTRFCHLLHFSSSLSNQCHSYPSKHIFHLSYPRSFTSIRSPLKCLYHSSHIFLSKKPQSTPCFCHTRYSEESSLSSVLQSSVSSFLSTPPIITHVTFIFPNILNFHEPLISYPVFVTVSAPLVSCSQYFTPMLIPVISNYKQGCILKCIECISPRVILFFMAVGPFCV